MSELVDNLQAKARQWAAEAETAKEQWRPMCEMLAKEYERLADERLSGLTNGSSAPKRRA